ncbi:MAG: polyphenol oxidase family protein, partial [Alphaproteobacteria bacterium]|nr:polyphenol oxidase family protein [Alphaproteobacteria bacterium]
MFVEDSILKSGDIRHGFFGRVGGVSRGIYNSLNCGLGSGDDAASVIENRGRVCESLRASADKFVTLHQIHSAACVIVQEAWTPEDRPQADALVTDMPGLMIGILTADCAPVLFSGTTPTGRPVVGAAHAGWGGALKGVVEATVRAMGELGVEPAHIRAAV